MSKYRWRGKKPAVAFVTGAASGLGQRFCQLLLAEGVSIAALDLDFDQSAQAALESCCTEGQTLVFLRANVADEMAVLEASAAAIDELGAPDLMLHCAGILETGKFVDTSAAQFKRSIDVNLHGTRNVAAALIPHMPAGSHVAIIASIAGITANYSYSSYSASKFAVLGLTEVLRMELIERDIDVSAICPAEIVTPMVIKEHEDEALDPIRFMLKDFGGRLSCERACDIIMRGIAGRKARIIPGFKAKWVRFSTHVTPTLSRWLARYIIKKGLRDQRG